jgi:muramoyltetrapeptide carboxypeptidase
MRTSGKPARVYPPRINKGDTVGIIAPGSPISRELLRAGCNKLESLGYKTFYFNTIFNQEHYFAGAHRQRAEELEQMFVRPEIRAIICARGGYGCNYLLPHLNLRIIRDNPKMFVGYSDVTTLLTYICDQADMCTYHGPMVIKDYAEAKNDDAGPLVLDNGEKGIEIRVGSERKQPRPGAAKGILYGGCLSLIAASLGTPYEVKTKNCILFLEDINAKPYQVDRMLMQLKYAGKLAEVRAAVFGEMVGCVQPGGQDYTLQEIVARVLSDLEIPVAFGLPSGHVSAPPNYSLPLGSMVELKVTADDFLLRSTGSGD